MESSFLWLLPSIGTSWSITSHLIKWEREQVGVKESQFANWTEGVGCVMGQHKVVQGRHRCVLLLAWGTSRDGCSKVSESQHEWHKYRLFFYNTRKTKHPRGYISRKLKSAHSQDTGLTTICFLELVCRLLFRKRNQTFGNWIWFPVFRRKDNKLHTYVHHYHWSILSADNGKENTELIKCVLFFNKRWMRKSINQVRNLQRVSQLKHFKTDSFKLHDEARHNVYNSDIIITNTEQWNN
jgi:hypothetical protein